MTPSETLVTLIAALLVLPLVLGVSLKAPRLVVFGFIGVLFMFSSSTWGQMQVENTIYSRGTGLFYFSLLNLLLFAAGVAALVRKLANPQNPYLMVPLSKYFLAFVFLLLSHIVIGVTSGVDLELILAYNGLINVFNMLVFMYLVTMAINDEKDKKNLLLLIIALAAIRAVFGMVRYLWFDGDSANPYRNFESMELKIFYFDIADNFVASLAAFCAAWLLTSPNVNMHPVKRLLLYGFLALEIAAVALSFRRSSLLGLALMFVFLLFRLPSQRRFKFIILATGILALSATIFFQQRLQFAADGNNVLTSLVYDILPKKGETNRFYELYAAANSVGGNWLFGLGAWGTFTGDESLLDYHLGLFDFVHSGFGHLVLKSGVVGLLLFCALIAAYTSHYLRYRNRLSGNSRLLADAGFAGFLFWVPTLLIGTPIIEFRTMLLIGLTLAMPFVAVGIEHRKLQQSRYPYYAAA